MPKVIYMKLILMIRLKQAFNLAKTIILYIELNPNTNSTNTNGSKTSLITITQASQPNKTTCQSSSVQSGSDSSQHIGASANSCNTKLSPIKMVQPIGFPTKLPPPPPQYQTASTTSTNLLKTNVLINKDQKPNPPIR